MRGATRGAPWPGPAWSSALVLLALVFRGVGCGGDPTSPPRQPATIRIAPAESPALLPGDAYQFTAAALDAHGSELTGITLVWRSQDTSVATVDDAGLVTARAAGAAELSVTADNASANAAVTVLVPVAQLSLSPRSPTILPGRTVQLQVSAEDSAGRPITGRSIVWETSDTSVAAVSTAGLLSGLRPGTAVVTVAISKKTATVPIAVLTPVTALQVMPGSFTLHPQDTLQLTATAADSLGNPISDRSTTWETSDAHVVTVSGSGLVVAANVGDAFVVADAEGQRDSALIHVRAAVGSVTVRPNNGALALEETLQLDAVVKDGDGNVLTGRAVVWTSSKPAVATVSSVGLVTAVQTGAATIRATSEGKAGQSSITVQDRVTTVTVSPASRRLVVGEVFQFGVTLRGVGGDVLTGREVTWSSENTAVARISADGWVTAQGEGTATIEATSEGVEGKATVEVSQPPPQSFVLVGAGDVGTCDGNGDEQTARILDTIPGTVFVAGDNAYPDGSDADYANCYDPTWGRHKARTRPVPGNHEYMIPGAAGYFNYFGAAAGDPATGYYSFDLGSWHVLALNTQFSGKQGTPQAEWVAADLAAHPATCTLAIWHVPLFGPDSASTRMKYVYQLLYDAGAEVVINGHEHNYQRFAPQTADGVADPVRGIREFVVGSGGRSLSGQGLAYPNREVFYKGAFGVLKLVLHPDSYDWQFIPVQGSSFTDTGSARCH